MGEIGSKPLVGKRVMVTRAAEQSETLVDALREAGAEAVVVPMVAFAPPDDWTKLDGCLQDGARFDWVFFTSQNAVRAVQERCVALGRSLKQCFPAAKIAAVAPTTAEAVQAAGLHPDYVATVHNGVALAGELSEEVRGKRVLLPRSDRANPDVIEELKRIGAQATSVVAYKTVAGDADAQKLQETIAKRPVDAVLFFSPSAVRHLREIVGIQRFQEFGRQAVFVAIGPVSDRALRKEGVERVLAAADTTVAASIAALGEFFSKAGQAQPAGAKPR